MAIYHFDASVISRSKGRSATAAAAYRTSERIEDRRTGEVHDYTRKSGVEHTEIIAPDHAPDWVHNRSNLWNAVEEIERRKDAQVAREVRVALPAELSVTQNADLVRDFVREQFVSRGMIADVALHSPGREGDQRNHHAHIMLTTREIGAEGFEAKNRDWNAKELLVDWRQSWAEHVNDRLERHNIHERVDHRTLAAQREDALTRADAARDRGDEQEQARHMAQAAELDRPALPSMSAGAWSMMRRGLSTPAAERWQDVRQIGTQVREVAAELREWARDWLDRVREGVQERTVMAGPSERQRDPQSALERLQAAREERGAPKSPQTALERLQAARSGRDTGRTFDTVEREEEVANQSLQREDMEKENDRTRELERGRAAQREREDRGHSR